MKNLIASIVVVAGFASIVVAQPTTRMDVQTSLNGIDWSGVPRVVNPGTAVQVRYTVTFVANDTTAIPVGFNSLTFQPTFSNWTAADTLAPFAVSGNNLTGGSVLDSAGTFGRVSPFAATGATTSDTYRGHVQTAAGTTYLRIARNTITNWVGLGPTSGSVAVNNFNGSGGLPAVQNTSTMPTAGHPYNGSITNVILAKFGFTLSSDTTPRTLSLSAPTEGMSRNATTGAREAAWFESLSASFGGIKGSVSVIPAEVQVIPAPASLALLGLGGIVVGRRRR